MSSVNELMKIIESKIRELINQIDIYTPNSSESSRIIGITKEITDNPFLLGEKSYVTEIENYLKEIPDKEQLEELLMGIRILEISCGAINSGIEVKLNQEELDDVNKIVSALEEVESIYQQKNEQIKKQRTATESLKLRYLGIYDKLRAGTKGRKYIKDNEIDDILDLIQEKDFQFKLEILEHIRKISEYVSQNQTKNIDEFEEQENDIEIDEDVLRQEFNKYGYQYDVMPDKYKVVLRKKCNMKKISKLFAFFEQNEEFAYLKKYGTEETPSERKSNLKRLVLILRYATPATMEYLLKDSRDRGVSINEILQIEGVYKPITKKTNDDNHQQHTTNSESDDLALTGSFEYYKANTKLLDDLSKEYQIRENDPSIDFYKTTLEDNPYFFIMPDRLLKNNLKIAKKYGLEFIERDGETCHIKSPTFLAGRSLQKKIDLMLENKPLYNYILKYPSILQVDKKIRVAVYRRMTGQLEIDRYGKIKNDINRAPEPPLDRTPVETIEKTIPQVFMKAAQESDDIVEEDYRDDEVTRKLELETDESQKGLTYNLNGIPVSKPKFLRVWTSIMNKYDKLEETDRQSFETSNFEKFDFEKTSDLLLLYALTYNSCYTQNEVECIKSFIRQKQPRIPGDGQKGGQSK